MLNTRDKFSNYNKMKTEAEKTENQQGNGVLPCVSISSLVEKSRIENAENRRKMFSNINKPTKDIEPYDNTHFLNMISAVNDALN